MNTAASSGFDTAAELHDGLQTDAGVFAEPFLRAAMADRELGCDVARTVLSEAVASFRRGESDPHGFGAVHAVAILAHHREAGAHALLLEICRDHELAGALLGDFIAGGLGGALWATSGGDAEGIRELFACSSADAYCREAAAAALWMGVVEGVLTREYVLDELSTWLEAAVIAPERLEGTDRALAGLVAAQLLRAAPRESAELLDRAITFGLVEIWRFGFADVRARVARDPDECWRKFTDSLVRQRSSDPLGLAGWAAST